MVLTPKVASVSSSTTSIARHLAAQFSSTSPIQPSRRSPHSCSGLELPETNRLGSTSPFGGGTESHSESAASSSHSAGVDWTKKYSLEPSHSSGMPCLACMQLSMGMFVVFASSRWVACQGETDRIQPLVNLQPLPTPRAPPMPLALV